MKRSALRRALLSLLLVPALAAASLLDEGDFSRSTGWQPDQYSAKRVAIQTEGANRYASLVFLPGYGTGLSHVLRPIGEVEAVEVRFRARYLPRATSKEPELARLMVAIGTKQHSNGPSFKIQGSGEWQEFTRVFRLNPAHANDTLFLTSISGDGEVQVDDIVIMPGDASLAPRPIEGPNAR